MRAPSARASATLRARARRPDRRTRARLREQAALLPLGAFPRQQARAPGPHAHARRPVVRLGIPESAFRVRHRAHDGFGRSRNLSSCCACPHAAPHTPDSNHEAEGCRDARCCDQCLNSQSAEEPRLQPSSSMSWPRLENFAHSKVPPLIAHPSTTNGNKLSGSTTCLHRRRSARQTDEVCASGSEDFRRGREQRNESGRQVTGFQTARCEERVVQNSKPQHID